MHQGLAQGEAGAASGCTRGCVGYTRGCLSPSAPGHPSSFVGSDHDRVRRPCLQSSPGGYTRSVPRVRALGNGGQQCDVAWARACPCVHSPGPGVWVVAVSWGNGAGVLGDIPQCLPGDVPACRHKSAQLPELPQRLLCEWWQSVPAICIVVLLLQRYCCGHRILR